MMNLSYYDIVSNNNSDITLARTCPLCDERRTITVDYVALLSGIRAYNNGTWLQDAFPTFTAPEREFLRSGICYECWVDMGAFKFKKPPRFDKIITYDHN